jgi:hypothetical protein
MDRLGNPFLESPHSSGSSQAHGIEGEGEEVAET